MVMALVACDAFRWQLPKATGEGDVRPGGDKRPDNGQESVPGSEGQRSIESVLSMDVGVGPGCEQSLNGGDVPLANGVHQRGVTLSGLQFEVSVVVREKFQYVGMALNGGVH